MVKMKILNLFAGIGGNRTLWGNKHEITAVEYDQKIALIYHKRFPNDKIIIGDAYKYLEDHFHEFDFIWASPPCQTHTCLMAFQVGSRYLGRNSKPRLPDLKLYSMVIFLNSFFSKNNHKWVIENVNPYYTPIIKPSCKVGRHLIWSNFYIDTKKEKYHKDIKSHTVEELCEIHSIDYKYIENLRNKKQILRNCVSYQFGKYILDCIQIKKQSSLDIWK